jgi:hypothetical protein
MQTSAGGAVFMDKPGALRDGTTRAVIVTMGDDAPLDEESTFEAQTFAAALGINCLAITPESRDDLMYEVQRAMGKGSDAGLHRGITSINFADAEAAEDFHSVRLTYSVVYSVDF